MTNRGYVYLLSPDHPRAKHHTAGYVQEHILVAEKALRKYLPPGAVVHHVNRVKGDNRPENLVICENQAYHLLLHARQRILDAGGDPDLHKICQTCRQLKEHVEFSVRRSSHDQLNPICRHCGSEHSKLLRQDPEVKRRRREHLRLRYHNDPEFRKSVKTRTVACRRRKRLLTAAAVAGER